MAVMWLAQCVTIMGFSFVFPFFPLFVQELGISDPAQAALWAGISGGAMGVTMFLFGPVWGILGDRYGRKKNVLRALFGGSILLAVTGLSGNVYQLTALRFLHGMVSGSFAPAMALVASSSPKERIAFGMGALQSAMFLGSTLGPLLGGLLADAVGYRNAFFVAGGTVGFSFLVVLVFARDDFQRPAESGPLFRHTALTEFVNLVASKELAPLLATIFVVQISPVLMFTVLPVLLDTMTPGSGASATGLAFGILGVMGALASYATGWLSARVGLTKILAISCLGAGLFYLPFIIVDSVPLLYVFLALGGLFQGAMLSSTSALLGLAMPPEKQGTGFGALQSVSSAAFGFGPLAGGVIATVTGLRSVFLVQSIGLFAAAVLVVRLLSGRHAGRQSLSADGASGVTQEPVGRTGGDGV